MTAKLATFVHVADAHGATHVFGPDDEVPEWAARKVVNPKAWEGGKAPYPADESAERRDEIARLEARLAELKAGGSAAAEPTDTPTEPASDGPPPKGGAGSGAQEWRAYAARKNVEVPADANREQVIDALTAAGVPTE